MKVNLGTVGVNDEQRRAIRKFYGRPGLASRKDVKNWLISHAFADLQTHTAEVADEQERSDHR